MAFSSVEVQAFSPIEAVQGKLKFQQLDDKLMHSVLENDKEVIEQGKLLEQAIDYGIHSLTPDLFMQQLVRHYKLTKQLYGERFLQELTGYEEGYIEKNIQIPEFQKELLKRIKEKLGKLQKEKLLGKSYEITEKGLELSALILAVQELDKFTATGMRGEKKQSRKGYIGMKGEIKAFQKRDRYRDIAIRKSLKKAMRRKHGTLQLSDLMSFERESKGQCYLIYALDASGSMKGEKIGICKKAGIALAYKAILERDKVGLIIFSGEVEHAIAPTEDFSTLLKEIVQATAGKETNIAKTIQKSLELFPQQKATKHLLLITDALPTAGKDPEQETLEQCSIARDKGITISLIGIQLDEKGRKLAEKMTEIGKGKFYLAKNLEEIDALVLEDYYGVA